MKRYNNKAIDTIISFISILLTLFIFVIILAALANDAPSEHHDMMRHGIKYLHQLLDK